MTSPEDSQRGYFAGLLAGARARWEQYSGLGGRMKYAVPYFLSDLWQGLRAGNVTVLFQNQSARDHAFASWYKTLSTGIARYESTTVVPGLVASAHGVILDLGPGVGIQVPHFDAEAATRVYGIEPNTEFADVLNKKLDDFPALRDKYTPIFCGVEDTAQLARYGIVPGSVDCIVCMQVMCSVVQPEEVARELYELLKPGGQIIFWEHCRNNDFITRCVQRLYGLVWPVLIGGCRLDRPIKEILLGAGEWEVAKIEEDMQPHLLMPRVWGRLIKPME